MEIRTLKASERERLLDLLDGWELADGWRGRDFFRRSIEIDPTYTDDNVWVALDGGELLSCVQIFPRILRVCAQPVPTGGIGTVFTREPHRTRGFADGLLERAAEAMRDRGMELSLLFSGRIPFYEKRGWKSWKSQHTVVRRPRSSARGSDTARPLAGDGAGGIESLPFDPKRDLDDVKRVGEIYTASRNGTVVRDDALWDASLILAGNPEEEFRVARQDGELVAYLRVARLYGRLVATELARTDAAPSALAALVDEQLGPREVDPLASADKPSAELRATMLLPAFDDLQFTLCLEQRGISSQPVDDSTNMIRCLDVDALAERLDAPLWPGESAFDYLARVLPPDGFVFWPADRF